MSKKDKSYWIEYFNNKSTEIAPAVDLIGDVVPNIELRALYELKGYNYSEVVELVDLGKGCRNYTIAYVCNDQVLHIKYSIIKGGAQITNEVLLLNKG